VPLALQRSEEELTDLLLERTKGRMAPACETFPQACTAVQGGSGGALLLELMGRKGAAGCCPCVKGGPAPLECMVRATSQGFP
jgi:hypothetical protein